MLIIGCDNDFYAIASRQNAHIGGHRERDKPAMIAVSVKPRVGENCVDSVSVFAPYQSSNKLALPVDFIVNNTREMLCKKQR